MSTPYKPSNTFTSIIWSPIQRWTRLALLSFQRNQQCKADTEQYTRALSI